MSQFYAEYPATSSGSGGVTSINGETGAVVIVGGTGITVTPSGQTITITNTGSGGGPGGAVDSVQFNDSGSFNGFGEWDGTTLLLGTGIIDHSALLDLSSTTQGFLLPRMTSAQMNAIVSPTNGLLIYNTDLGEYDGFTGISADSTLTESLSFGNLTFTAQTPGTAGNSINVRLTVSGSVGVSSINVIGSAIQITAGNNTTYTAFVTALNGNAPAFALVATTNSGVSGNIVSGDDFGPDFLSGGTGQTWQPIANANDFVPYNGAFKDVDLNQHSITNLNTIQVFDPITSSSLTLLTGGGGAMNIGASGTLMINVGTDIILQPNLDVSGAGVFIENAPLQISQITTPTHLPASGTDKLYFKSDDNLYKLTAAGVETQIGSGGSGITSINSDTTAAQVIAAGTGISVSSTGGTTTITNTSTASNSFTTVVTDAGTDPVASTPTSTLTLTSSDSSVTITGDLSTNTVNFQSAGAGGANTSLSNLSSTAINADLLPAASTAFNIGTVGFPFNTAFFIGSVTSGSIITTDLLITGTPGFQLTSGTLTAGNVLTSDASGFGTWQPPSGGGGGFTGVEIVQVDTPSSSNGGGGTTNPTIVVWSNVVTNTGTDITYNSDPALGDTFILNTAGFYAMTCSMTTSAATMSVAITINETGATIPNPAYTVPSVQRVSLGPAINFGGSQGGVYQCVTPGDVIMVHTDTNTNAPATYSSFKIQRIS